MKQWIKTSFFVAISALMTASCGPTTQTPSISDLHVVGPHIRPAVPGEFPGAVALRLNGRPHCTGTLVAPQLVITAAHCVSSINTALLKVHVGLGSEPDFLTSGTSISSFGVSPAYQKDVGGNSDVAYLSLAEPISNIEIVPVATDMEELRSLLAPGTRSTIVGFGAHDNDVSGTSGIKYIGPGNVKFYSRNEVWLGDAQGDGCSGDSGGPVYGQINNGDWRVFGVTSRGPSPCGLEEWPGIWGLMHAHVCWIEQNSGQHISGSTIDCSDNSTSDPTENTDFTNIAGLCQDKDLPAATRRTLEALRTVFAERSPSANDRSGDIACDQLQAWANEETQLDLSRFMISDLRPIRAFKKLQNLDVEDNLITDPSPLNSGFEQLQVLHIGWNDIPSFTELDERATSGLRIRGRGVQSAAPDFHSQSFEAQCNAAAQPGADAALKSDFEILRKHLCYNRLCLCAQAARNLRAIRVMDLGGSAISSLEPLRGAAGLQYLKISDTKLTDVSPLAEVENLKLLDISGSQVRDLNSIETLIKDNHLQIVGEAEEQEATLSQLSASQNELDLLIPDGVKASDAITIPLEVLGEGTISNLSISLRITHQTPSDLIIRLMHPSGRYVQVARRPIGNGPNYEASFAFGQDGTFVRDLRALKRLPASGTWQLRIHDAIRGETGRLQDVKLTIGVKPTKTQSPQS